MTVNIHFNLDGTVRVYPLYDGQKTEVEMYDSSIRSVNEDRLSSLKKYITPFQSRTSTVPQVGILPPGVLYLDDQFVVFERPPEKKMMFIIPKLMDGITSKSQPVSFQIPVPWQLYIARYSSYKDDKGVVHLYPDQVKMHFMRTNLMSVDQEVFLAPLPNFYTDGMLCRPFFDSMEEFNRHTNDLAGVIASAYDWIWNSGTNLDLTESVAQYYIQMPKRNSVSPVNGGLYPGSRYCSWAHVETLMKNWETKTLEEVLFADWPQNTFVHSAADDHVSNFLPHLEKYLEERGIDPHYDMHYDEDSGYSYQCEDDPSCHCRVIQATYDHADFMRHIATTTPQMTYASSFESFLVNLGLRTPSVKYTPESAAQWVNNISMQLIYNG